MLKSIPLGLLVIGMLAFAVAYASWGFLTVADVLPAPVERLFLDRPNRSAQTEANVDEGGMNIVIVEGPPPAGVRGVQAALFTILLAGIPLAGVGRSLVGWLRRGQLVGHRERGAAYLLACVAQAASLVIALPLSALCLLAVVLERTPRTLAIAAFLMGTVLASIAGFRWWRELLAAASAETPRHFS
jgi:hypothetical protein